MRRLSVALLVAGLLFSTFMFRATLSPAYNEVAYNPPTFQQVLGVRVHSAEKYTTTAFAGYILFIIFALINLRRARREGVIRAMFFFLVLNVLCLSIELQNWIRMFQGRYEGGQMRVGLLIVIWGLWLWDSLYRPRLSDGR